MKTQQGMVLFFALIMLLLMTIIGVALAVNASQSMKMAGASSQRVNALAAAQGAMIKVLNSDQGTDLSTLTQSVTIQDTNLGVTNVLTPMSGGDLGCQRSMDASSTNLISCRRMEITSEAQFGRNNLGRLKIVSGVEQQVLTGS